MTTTDIIGFIGVTILLVAYLLNLFKFFTENSRMYISLNIVGAGIACFASVLLSYVPFIILEGVWTLVSAFALVKSFRNTAIS